MLSFGNLTAGRTVDDSALSYGTPVYDDAILRAARSRTSAGQPSGTRAINRPPLSFGSAVPTSSRDPFSSGVGLSLPTSVPRSSSVDRFDLTNFLQTASFGVPANDTRSSRAIYDDAIIRASRSPVQAIPQVHTSNIDGGAGLSSALKRAASDVLASIGSRGDGDVVPVVFGNNNRGSDNTLLYVAGAAALGLVAYYALS